VTRSGSVQLPNGRSSAGALEQGARLFRRPQEKAEAAVGGFGAGPQDGRRKPLRMEETGQFPATSLNRIGQ